MKCVDPLKAMAVRIETHPRDACGGGTRRTYEALRTVAGIWVLGYYLVPNALLGRISPGGLASEFADTVSARFIGIGAPLLFIAAILWMASQQRSNPPLRIPPLSLATAAFGAPLVLASVMTIERQNGGTGAAAVIAAISFGIIAIAICREQFVCAVTSVASIQGIYAIVYKHEHINQVLSGAMLRSGGTINQPNQLYTLMIVALPFAITGMMLAKNSIETFAYLAAGSVELAALVISGSRGGVIAAAIGAVGLCYLVTRSVRKSLVAFLCVAVPILAFQAVGGEGAVNRAR